MTGSGLAVNHAPTINVWKGGGWMKRMFGGLLLVFCVALLIMPSWVLAADDVVVCYYRYTEYKYEPHCNQCAGDPLGGRDWIDVYAQEWYQCYEGSVSYWVKSGWVWTNGYCGYHPSCGPIN